MRFTAQKITARIAESFRTLKPRTDGEAASSAPSALPENNPAINNPAINNIATPSFHDHLPPAAPHKPNPSPIKRTPNEVVFTSSLDKKLNKKTPDENEQRPQIALNILVAEDNYASQLVAKTLLLRGGHSVTTVNNGYEAVKACLSKHFDIVLMDIEMPKMTGVEATQIIRTTIGPNQHTKIIALTAFGCVSKKFDYLDSGINDVLAKPLKMTELNSCLTYQPYLVHPDGLDDPKVDDSELASPNVSEEFLLNVTTITTLLNNAGADHIQTLLKAFWQGAYALLDDMQHAIQHNDPDALASTAHALKGSAINFGLSQLSEQAAALKDRAPDEAIIYLENLEHCMTRSRKALGSFINKYTA